MLTNQTQSLLSRSSMIAMSTLAALSLSATAGTPKAMTMVPSDAEVVVVLPNVGELLSDIDTMNAMLGEFGQPEMIMMTSMVRGMPGLNLDGSAAVVLDMQDNWEDEPDAVVLLPVNSFEDLTQGSELVNGIAEMPMGGDSIYFRDAGGGYAMMSNDQALLAGFTPASHLRSLVPTIS